MNETSHATRGTVPCADEIPSAQELLRIAELTNAKLIAVGARQDELIRRDALGPEIELPGRSDPAAPRFLPIRRALPAVGFAAAVASVLLPLGRMAHPPPANSIAEVARADDVVQFAGYRVIPDREHPPDPSVHNQKATGPDAPWRSQTAGISLGPLKLKPWGGRQFGQTLGRVQSRVDLARSGRQNPQRAMMASLEWTDSADAENYVVFNYMMGEGGEEDKPAWLAPREELRITLGERVRPPTLMLGLDVLTMTSKYSTPASSGSRSRLSARD